MLSNACLLLKFRFDTAENEPAKTLQKLLSLLQFCYQFPGTAARAVLPRSGAGRSGRAAAGRRVRRAVGAPGDCRRGPLSLSLSLRSACVCVCECTCKISEFAARSWASRQLEQTGASHLQLYTYTFTSLAKFAKFYQNIARFLLNWHRF